MTRGNYTGPGLDTGMDWSVEGISEVERATMLRWYENTHGRGDLSVVQMAPFMIEHDPAGFKRYRRTVVSLQEGKDGVGLPQAATVLLFLHLYAVRGVPREAYYDVIAARGLGLTKAQVIETLSFAFLAGGPAGISAVAELTPAYLAEWDDAGEENTVEWPEGWSTGASLPEGDEDHLDLLASLHGEAYAAERDRTARAIGRHLPIQMAPLFILHLATWNLWPGVIKRSLRQARALGVRRHHAVQAMAWASFIYGGVWKLQAALDDGVADLLRDWE